MQVWVQKPPRSGPGWAAAADGGTEEGGAGQGKRKRGLCTLHPRMPANLPLPPPGPHCSLGNIAFAFGFAQVLMEIQDTLRQPPKAEKTMRKVSRVCCRRLSCRCRCPLQQVPSLHSAAAVDPPPLPHTMRPFNRSLSHRQ